MRRVLLALLVLVMALSLTACFGGSDGDSGDSSDAGSSAMGPDNNPAVEDGVVRVTLGWDEPIDMDLEIWDAAGENAETAAGLENEDIMDGTEGREYFDFTGAYSDGEYVVSVYFAEEMNVVESANATLEVIKADGSTETRSSEIMWEEGSDQWHAFSIDAATGDIADIDEFIETVVEDAE